MARHVELRGSGEPAPERVPPSPEPQPEEPEESARARRRNQPIRPSWVTNPGELRAAIGDHIHDAAHDVGWHAWRLPNYYARLARRSPEGVKKALREWHRWALDVEGKEVRRGHVGIMAGLQGHERSVLAN